jgi:hypothetical protein
MRKLVARQPGRAKLQLAFLGDQAVLFFELLRECPEQWAQRQARDRGHDLGREGKPLHAGDAEDLALLLIQAPDALLDHAFHPCRQRRPIWRPRDEPTPVGVLRQIAVFLQSTQQLDSE